MKRILNQSGMLLGAVVLVEAFRLTNAFIMEQEIKPIISELIQISEIIVALSVIRVLIFYRNEIRSGIKRFCKVIGNCWNWVWRQKFVRLVAVTILILIAGIITLRFLPLLPRIPRWVFFPSSISEWLLIGGTLIVLSILCWLLFQATYKSWKKLTQHRPPQPLSRPGGTRSPLWSNIWPHIKAFLWKALKWGWMLLGVAVGWLTALFFLEQIVPGEILNSMKASLSWKLIPLGVLLSVLLIILFGKIGKIFTSVIALTLLCLLAKETRGYWENIPWERLAFQSENSSRSTIRNPNVIVVNLIAKPGEWTEAFEIPSGYKSEYTWDGRPFHVSNEDGHLFQFTSNSWPEVPGISRRFTSSSGESIPIKITYKK